MTSRAVLEYFAKQIAGGMIDKNTRFIEANNSDCSRLNLEKILLAELNLSGVNFSHSNLRKANLERACLERVNFEGTNLKNTILDGANLTDAIELEPKQLMKADFGNIFVRPTDRLNYFLVSKIKEKRKRRKQRIEYEKQLRLLEATITKLINNHHSQPNKKDLSVYKAGSDTNFTVSALTAEPVINISSDTNNDMDTLSSNSISSSSISQIQMTTLIPPCEKRYSLFQAVKVKDRTGCLIGVGPQQLDKTAYLSFRNYLEKHVASYCKTVSSLAPPLKVFISYAWPVEGNESFLTDKHYEASVVRIAKDLEAVGFEVFLDRWEDRRGKVLTSFVEKMEQANFFLPIGTRLYLNKYEKRVELENDPEHVVRAEGISLNYIAVHSQRWREKIIPILLEGTAEETLPFLLRPNLPLDLNRFDYFEQFFTLVKDMYRIGQRDKGYKKLQQNFFKELKALEAKSPQELEALCEQLKTAAHQQASSTSSASTTSSYRP